MIIDLECDTPTEAVKEATIKLLRAGGGFVHRGYFRQFGRQWAALLGMSEAEFEAAQREQGLIALAVQIAEKHLEQTMTEAEVIAMLDRAGVQQAGIGTTGMWSSLEDRAAFARRYPDRLIPFYRCSPHDGMADLRQFEQTVREQGFRGLVVSGFRDNLPSNDQKYYPYYAKCVELKVPARITTSLHLYTDRPMDLCRPAYIDQVACDFAELKIVAGLGGWPWIPELIATARRHRNVFIDLSCVRPKNLASPASGYAELIEQINRGLQDQFVFASGWGTQGIPLAQVIAETEDLARNDAVRRKWMHDNAQKLLAR
jgi:uncharacterized protein